MENVHKTCKSLISGPLYYQKHLYSLTRPPGPRRTDRPTHFCASHSASHVIGQPCGGVAQKSVLILIRDKFAQKCIKKSTFGLENAYLRHLFSKSSEKVRSFVLLKWLSVFRETCTFANFAQKSDLFPRFSAKLGCFDLLSELATLEAHYIVTLFKCHELFDVLYIV